MEENRPDVLFLTVVSELVQRGSSGRGNPVITKTKEYKCYLRSLYTTRVACDM